MGGGIRERTQGLTGIAEWGFPEGMTFLTPDVRSSVEKQLAHARLTGEPYIGILEGTVVVLETRKTPQHLGGTYAVRVDLTVGPRLSPSRGPGLPG